jgi:hypothetical protein
MMPEAKVEAEVEAEGFGKRQKLNQDKRQKYKDKK